MNSTPTAATDSSVPAVAPPAAAVTNAAAPPAAAVTNAAAPPAARIVPAFTFVAPAAVTNAAAPATTDDSATIFAALSATIQAKLISDTEAKALGFAVKKGISQVFLQGMRAEAAAKAAVLEWFSALGNAEQLCALNNPVEDAAYELDVTQEQILLLREAKAKAVAAPAAVVPIAPAASVSAPLWGDEPDADSASITLLANVSESRKSLTEKYAADCAAARSHATRAPAARGPSAAETEAAAALVAGTTTAHRPSDHRQQKQHHQHHQQHQHQQQPFQQQFQQQPFQQQPFQRQARKPCKDDGNCTYQGCMFNHVNQERP